MIADLELHTNPLLEASDSVVPIAQKMSKIQMVKRANHRVSSCDPRDPGVLALQDCVLSRQSHVSQKARCGDQRY